MASSSAADCREGAVALARRWLLQRAPAEAVVAAYTAQHGWDSLASQEALYQALVADAAAQRVGRKYQQRVLKALLRMLDGREICESLLEAYISRGVGASGVQDARFIRTFEVEGHAIPLSVSDQIGGEAETSGCVWPACPALSAWLHARAEDLAGFNVLELGSGTGLAALTVACCANVNRVVATDNSFSALLNLRQAIDELEPSVASRIGVAHLDWSENGWLQKEGDGLNALHGEGVEASAGDLVNNLTKVPFDLLIASDVAYDPILILPLCRTIRAVLRSSAALGSLSPRAWLAAERRSKVTWAVLEEELHKEGLIVGDLSYQLRVVAGSQKIFYCDAESLDRIHLLEIRASAE